jgi:hypothetical protein
MATAAIADAIEAMHARRTRFAQVDAFHAITELRVCFCSRRENEGAERSVPQPAPPEAACNKQQEEEITRQITA